MRQIQLFLIPAPGQKPSFLATVELLNKNDNDNRTAKIWEESLPSQIVLETYTRDGWAWKPNPKCFTSFQVQSTDGRKKLPGFLKYLKERQKACYGKFQVKQPQQSSSSSSICVVSYIQPNQPNENSMECRIALDLNQIPNCPLATTKRALQPQQQQQNNNNNTKKRKAGGMGGGGGGGMGFLGNLVGAQKRTNHHVMVAKAPTKTTAKKGSSSTENNAEAGDANATEGETEEKCGTKTAQDIMAEFRQSCQDKMLDFDISDDPVLKIDIKLSTFHNEMVLATEERNRINLEILKFIVYEQAEEVNEEWIAHKEPSEFLDEFTVAVYKEGEAPLEVMEEMNQGEMPDEIRGQEKAMADQANRAAELKEIARAKELQQQALKRVGQDDGGLDALNTNQRDRRTIEEIQRDFNS